jgi:hypothetical protein
MLTGGVPLSGMMGSRLGAGHYGDNMTLCYTQGGYHLIIGWGKAFALNLDIAAMFNNQTLIAYRQEILGIADRLGVPLIPVGELALHRASGQGELGHTLDLVHRQCSGDVLEAVFTLVKDDKKRFYLSGYDTQESPPRVGDFRSPGLYFLCRLPHPVDTVNEAREALKPESVKRAEAQGIEVRRQGDLFAIKSELTRADIEAQGGVFREYSGPDTVGTTEVSRITWDGSVVTYQAILPPQANPGLYGTAHICITSAQLPNGVWVGSGGMVHDPHLLGESRNPDHSPLELDDGWWLITPNTVPKTLGPRLHQSW